MLTEKQIELFTVFVKYPFKKQTRQEIKNIASEKSNNALSLAFSQFKEENLLIEKKVGKSSLYSLNFENNLVYHYIALSNEKRLKKIVTNSINYIEKEVKKITPFFSIAIFGSYAIQEEKKKSDLDIAIFIEDKKKIKEIELNLRNAELYSIIKLDLHVITREDMVEMLSNYEENQGKQIARKHMAIYNHRLFYDLLNEGMKNGFKL
ncbi:MAG: nucleotidyltransferase domain-containing protein [Minisyncoccales bacterium]